MGDCDECGGIAGGAQSNGNEPVCGGPPYVMGGPSVIDAIDEAALFLKEGASISEVAVARL